MDEQGTEKVFPFDIIPRVIEAGTWRRLEKTAAQVAAEEADEELEAIPAIAV